MEDLFKWFAHEFVLFHCLSGNKEELYFTWFVKVDPCAVDSLLVVLKGINCGCRILILFQVGMFIILDSAPESIKKSTSRSGFCNCFDFGLSKRSWIAHIFSFCKCVSLGMF